MNFDKVVKHLFGEIMGAAHRRVHADHTVQFLRFFIDRPVVFMPKRLAQPDRWKHDAREF